jgi:hypothetical protein
MTKKTKKLEEYINTLPIIGAVIFIGGIYIAVIIMKTDFLQDWSQIYFYFKTIGAIFGYVFISRWHPGGRVTLTFDKKLFDDNEKTLDKLIIKYRNNYLMLLPLFVYIIADFILTQKYSHVYSGSAEGYLASLILGAGLMIMIVGGIKYISAWWGIKRNWKKEFGE